MPLVIAPADFGLWLGEQGHGAARLMRTGPDALFAPVKVGPAVNSNRAEGPGLIEPAGDGPISQWDALISKDFVG